jgi:hypothetical protein
MANNNLKNEIKEFILDELEGYEDREIYGSDLSWEITMDIDNTGSVNCNAYLAKEWIKENFDLCGDLFNELENEYGMLTNPFESPERFQVQCYIALVHRIIDKCEIVQDNWNKSITFDKETLQTLKDQIESVCEKLDDWLL